MSESPIIDLIHFSVSTEQTVRMSNREVMTSMMEPVTEDQFVAISLEVAESRANYLIAALKLGADKSAPSTIELKKLREDFEEKRAAFSAITTAIDRGYIDYSRQWSD